MSIKAFFFKQTSEPFRFLILALLLGSIAAFSFQNFKLGENPSLNNLVFNIVIRHFGIDSEEMEESITQPLENLLFGLPGLKEMTSNIETGKSQTLLRFHPGTDYRELYLMIRDTVDRLYQNLPSSVQKPSLFSTGADRSPSFIYSLFSSSVPPARLRALVEKTLKQQIQNIEGVGEVEIVGSELEEIQIEIDERLVHPRGTSTVDISRQIQEKYLLLYLGDVHLYPRKVPVVWNSRWSDERGFRNLAVRFGEGKSQLLSDFADITRRPRKNESVNRVNGRESLSLYVRLSGTGSSLLVGESLRRLVDRFQVDLPDLETTVLRDEGLVFQGALENLLLNFLISLGVVSLFLLLAFRKVRYVLAMVTLFMGITLATLATINLAGWRLSLELLSGFSVSIGLIADLGIFLIGLHEFEKNKDSFSQSLGRFFPSLLFSTLTTIIVVLPIVTSRTLSTESVQMSVGYLIQFGLAFLLFLLFFPPLLGPFHTPSPGAYENVEGKFQQLLKFPLRKPKLVLLGTLLLTAGFSALLIFLPKGQLPKGSLKFLQYHVEFPSGTSVASVDQGLQRLTRSLSGPSEIQHIESHARQNNGTISILLREPKTQVSSLTESLQQAASRSPDVYVFPLFEEYTGTKVEITVIGPEPKVMDAWINENLQPLGQELQATDLVKHYKPGNPSLTLQLFRDRLGRLGTHPQAVIEQSRVQLFGPVSFKWFDAHREMDVRVFSPQSNIRTRANVKNMAVSLGETRSVPLYEIGAWFSGQDDRRLYRHNRQRSLSFGFNTVKQDIVQLQSDVDSYIQRNPLPQGYSYRFDRDLLDRTAENYQLFFSLAIAVLLVYFLLGVQFQSLKSPLLVLASLPIALVFPLVALWVARLPLSSETLIGLIYTVGLVVNNAIILLADVKEQKVPLTAAIMQKILKLRTTPILTTGLSTLVGLLPFLLFSLGSTSLTAVLSFIIFFGVLGSMITSLWILPGLFLMCPTERLANKLSKNPLSSCLK